MSVFLPVLLGLMMFTMGLSLQSDDFKRVVETPKSVSSGLVCQLLLLPLLGFGIARAFSLSPELTLGFMIICACPGGVFSNYVSYTAKGDVALSISLTVVSSIVCVFSIPVLINVVQDLMNISRSTVSLPIVGTMVTIAKMTLLPVALGMLTSWRFPRVASQLSGVFSKACTLLLIGYILYLWYLQSDAIIAAASKVGLPVLVLIVLSSTMAWCFSLLVKLPENQRVTLVIETGIQNSALAFTITAVILNNPLLSIPAVFYSLAMFIPSLLLVYIGRRKLQLAESAAR